MSKYNLIANIVEKCIINYKPIKLMDISLLTWGVKNLILCRPSERGNLQHFDIHFHFIKYTNKINKTNTYIYLFITIP